MGNPTGSRPLVQQAVSSEDSPSAFSSNNKPFKLPSAPPQPLATKEVANINSHRNIKFEQSLKFLAGV